MKIQIGSVFLNDQNKPILYQNKTSKYIVPILSSLGADFVTRYNSVYKMAVGIGDMLYTEEQCKFEQQLFLLLKTSIAPLHFIAFLMWIKEQDYYRDDYVFDDIQKTDLHMIVIKMPVAIGEGFDMFKQGMYSRMYPTSYIDRFFKDYPNVQKILIQDHEYKVEFVDSINKEFNSTVPADEWEGELDKPPTEKEEYFNDHLKPKP